MKIRLFAATNIGLVRDHNEDDFSICKDLETGDWTYGKKELINVSEWGTLAIVADGMGGANAGEVASKMVIESAINDFKNLDSIPSSSSGIQRFLKGVLVRGHEKLIAH
jgi:protein phosphatase